MEAIPVSVAGEVAKKAEEYLVAWVCRHCGYLIFSNRNVRQLKDELANLDLERQRVQHLIEEAKGNLKPIEPKVKKWMKDVNPKEGNVAEEVETVTAKAGNVVEEEVENVPTKAGALLLEHDGRVNKTCFYGWLPNLKARYRLGKEASRMVKDITELIGRGQFQKVHFENPPPGLVIDGASSSSAHHGGTLSESQASKLEDIMNALDDEKLHVIGIHGPGGVGKTTLSKAVEEKLRNEKKLFKFIARSEVSQTPALTKIQDNIAHYLGADLKAETSEHGRRSLLYKRLQNDKVLIILDDLWDKLDLEALGIPSGEESSKCKLLLTSRSKDVLEVQMRANETFVLDKLNYDEAFRLFEKEVDNRLKDDEELKAKAAQLVHKLPGLPLLIISVASTLRCSDVYTWDSALIRIEDPTIADIVKWSYDHLKSKHAQSLFLLCGLIGGTIQVELLLGLGLGLGLFEGYEVTMQSSRSRLNDLLGRLRSVCLLENGGDDKETVTIHDLYSEVVVSTQFRDQNSLMMISNYGLWTKEKLEKCWAISLTDAGKDRLAELTTCQFPELEILMSSHPKYWRKMSQLRYDGRVSYKLLHFNYMKKLRVLRLRSIEIAPLPSSIEILENLRSLYLDDCHLEDVAILGKLRALQILSFAGSTISKLPKEIGGLTKLRSLNLNWCSELEIIERGALKGLINLEELYMRKSYEPWMDDYKDSSESCNGEDEEPSEPCNAWLAELKSLTKLTALEISIPDPAVVLEDGDPPFGNLIRFWINIGGYAWWTRESLSGIDSTMMLNLEGVNGILLKEWVLKTLQRTQYLRLRGLRESKESAHELCNGGFLQLKHLIIENSTSIKYIALSAFPSLESLHLDSLDNLEKIYDATGEPECSGKLKYINAFACPQLKTLLNISDKRLVHLEKIEVKECESMQAIITYDARNVGAAAADVIVELPNVHTLDLHNLPSMTSFCIGDNGAPIQVSFPCLASLSMFRLSKLENLCHGPPESFSKLEVVSGQYCPQLKTLLNVSSKRLVHLEKIKAGECDSMQAIITYDTRNVEATPADVIVELPKVRILKLDKLPSMTTFCIGADDAPFQLSLPCLDELRLTSVGSLKKIWYNNLSESSFCKLASFELYNCPDIVNVFPSTIIGGLPNLKEFHVVKCSSLESLVDCGSLDSNTEQVMSFPFLRSLCIEDCPNVVAFVRTPTNAERPLGEMVEENDESAQPFFNEMVTFPNIKKLEIKGIRCEELWNNQIPHDSFCKLESLFLVNCGKLGQIASSYMWKRLQRCLEILRVISCPLIKVIYEGDGTDTESSKLWTLVMRDLDGLKHIWRSDGQPNVPFPNLRQVGAVRCSHLEILFASFTEKFLGQIQELAVESCEDMKLIAGCEEGEGGISREITFLRLQDIVLQELPQFRSFLPENYSGNFPSLRVLNQKRCGNESDKNLGDWSHYDFWGDTPFWH